MKKIMFNDRYGLTNAVLQGSKTMTQRIVPNKYIADIERGLKGVSLTKAYLDGRAYRVGEVLAVAQSYKDVVDKDVRDHYIPRWSFIDDHCDEAGYYNKMFVKADLMPHRIRITDIKVERMQDISEEDCLMEGIVKTHGGYGVKFGKDYNVFDYNPRDAFATLINKVSGKCTWESNPFVFAYSFELVK